MSAADYIPIRSSSGSSRTERRASAARDQAELDVAKHAMKAWAESTKDQIDSMALGEAVRTSAEEEMDTYDEMMLIAGESAVKQELVLRKLALMSNKNNGRLRRRFS